MNNQQFDKLERFIRENISESGYSYGGLEYILVCDVAELINLHFDAIAEIVSGGTECQK